MLNAYFLMVIPPWNRDQHRPVPIHTGHMVLNTNCLPTSYHFFSIIFAFSDQLFWLFEFVCCKACVILVVCWPWVLCQSRPGLDPTTLRLTQSQTVWATFRLAKWGWAARSSLDSQHCWQMWSTMRKLPLHEGSVRNLSEVVNLGCSGTTIV